ncbi:hypothetical protein Zmor_024157 [Zophobas morio]|uniref:carbonic anhydrase n=1 Tax=Zophobas morio TaxID=2755281 RepID=A0AA38HY04_9CUCU|nr:hypothetical protein Zmor_024157 [Zophobas morio]
MWPAQHCLNGKRQSPINIIVENTTLAKNEPLQFDEKFGEKLKANIRSEDYIVEVYLDDLSTKAEILEGGLNGSYSFLRLEFHWLSQHTIDNRSFPLEVTSVFYASKYGDPVSAIPHEDGFVALSTFYNITDQSNPIFDNLLRSIPEIRHKMNNDPVPLKEEIILSDFMSKNDERYFTYPGSYTRPVCDEIVTCLVFEGPFYLSFDQYYTLTGIKDDEDNPIFYNNRDIQNQNGRTVYRSA